MHRSGAVHSKGSIKCARINQRRRAVKAAIGSNTRQQETVMTRFCVANAYVGHWLLLRSSEALIESLSDELSPGALRRACTLFTSRWVDIVGLLRDVVKQRMSWCCLNTRDRVSSLISRACSSTGLAGFSDLAAEHRANV